MSEGEPPASKALRLGESVLALIDGWLISTLCELLQHKTRDFSDDNNPIRLFAEISLCSFRPLEESYTYIPLHAIADDECDLDARLRAVRVLGKLAVNSEAAASRLIQALGEAEPTFRKGVALQFGNCEVAGDAIRGALEAVAENDPAADVLRAASESLSKLS